MAMANPVLRTSNRSSERGIVALMFTKRQPGYRGGYWSLSLSGNCCGQLMVAAEGSVEAGAVNVIGLKPVVSDTPLSLAVINYVRETGESLVVGNGCADERFANDPYIVSTKPRSLMSVPIIQHGMLGGILYLENNLVPDAFTADRVEMLRVISA